jgi:hypothetical protein
MMAHSVAFGGSIVAVLLLLFLVSRLSLGQSNPSH